MSRAALGSKPGRSAIGVALILAAMAWLAARSDDWGHAFEPAAGVAGYYDRLAQGFRLKHLYLDTAASSGLIDASLFHGRVYLYFGAVPAALLFLPYLLLTGHDLPSNVAVLGMVALGFALYLHIYLEARRRYFPGTSRAVHAGCVLLLAFASGTPVLLTASRVYEVAIAGGYLGGAAASLGIFQALVARQRAAGGVALASLALGLAAGCRPNYVLALPCLLGVGILLSLDEPPAGRRRHTAHLAFSALVPAALIGLCLIWYNYARFGHPLEFGVRYQSSEISSDSAAFFWPNLQSYYLRPPNLSPYFPYVFPLMVTGTPPGYHAANPIHGQWPVFLLGLWCSLWLVAAGKGRDHWPSELRRFFFFLMAEFLCMFLSVAFFVGSNDRYVVDFQGPLILALALAGGWGAGHRSPSARKFDVRSAGFLLLAGAAAAANIFASLQSEDIVQRSRPAAYRLLAHYGNYPSSLLGHNGPVSFRVTFPRAFSPGTRQPLITTGMPGATDVLYVDRQSDKSIELVLEHPGYGDVRSGPIAIQPGTPYTMEADFGSFYPPRPHPYFQGWPVRAVERLKTIARVRFNGADVITEHFPFYDSPPGRIYFGRNPSGTDGPFTGTIGGIHRLSPPDPSAFIFLSEPGVWRLSFELPPVPAASSYPILASGINGDGNLLFLRILPDLRLHFGLDEWGIGMGLSPVLASLKPGTHQLEIFIGPQVARQRFPPEWRFDPTALKNSASVMRVWMDGAAVWTVPIRYHLDSYDWVSVGSNPQGFSSAGPFFVGGIKSLPYSTREMQEFIARNLAETAAQP